MITLLFLSFINFSQADGHADNQRVQVSQALVESNYAKAESILKKNENDFLMWARYKFQTGDYKSAVKFYEKISKSSSDFISSREELAWAYLQSGDWGALRGLLVHLNNAKLVPIENRLEGRVLSAISFLKKCEFDKAKIEIEIFKKELAPLVKNLDSNRNKNLNKNLKPLVAEAITKMRYVKVELLGQLQKLENLRAKKDVLSSTSQVADMGEGASRNILDHADGYVFPLKADLWVDELFNARSVSPSECDDIRKKRE